MTSLALRLRGHPGFVLSPQGAHFAQDNVNRPGISGIFFDHANEEREHAFKLADYLSMRGDDNTNYLQASYVSTYLCDICTLH